MSTFEVGLLFTIVPATYIPAMVLVQYVPKRVDKRITLTVAAALLGVSTFFNGPS